MNAWFRRFLLVLTIGGGFTGIALDLQFLSRGWQSGWIARCTITLFLFVHAYAVYVGLRLADGRERIWQLVLLFALQLPVIQSPWFVYRFSTGVQAAIGFVGFRPTWDFQIGAITQMLISSGAPFGLGVNLVAAIILFVLCSPALHGGDAVPAAAAPYDY